MNTELFTTEGLPSQDVQFDWAGDTVVGKVRQVNEDCFAGRNGVFVVADGMGGHEAGDVASQIVVDFLMEAIGEAPIAFNDLERIVIAANAEVRREALASGHTSMGATLVAIVWVTHLGAPYLAVVNVGDSRCYLSDDDGFRCVTHDHSVVQDLVDCGAISSEEAQHHPDRNVVTRAMGVDPDVVADYVLLPAVGEQRLLLCSDGVSAQLNDREIRRTLTHPNTPDEVVRGMIGAVMGGQARDNATAVVVDVVWTVGPPSALSDVEITSPRPIHPNVDDRCCAEPIADQPTLITSVPRALTSRSGFATSTGRHR